MTTVTYDDSLEQPTLTTDVGQAQPVYTRRTDKRGRELYYKDGKLHPKRLIPETVLVQDLDYGHNITVKHDEPEPAPLEYPEGKVCVVCDSPGTLQRYLNGRFIYTCADHFNETLGNIVAHLRERGGGTAT